MTALAAGLVVLVAAACGPLLGRRDARGAAVLGAAVAAMLACPLLLPREAPLLRVLVLFVSAMAGGKMLDYYLSGPHAGGSGAYFRYLVHPGGLDFPSSLRKPADVSRAREVRRLLGGLAALACGVVSFAWLVTTRFASDSFPADHVAKMVAFGFTIEGVACVSCAGARLAGFHAVPIVELAFLARSPAEFWRRYNRLAGAWLYRHVFLPCGGRAHPLRAVLVTFLVSGAVHELLFAIALERVTGYQLAFFGLHGIGVALSRPLDRLGRRPAGAAAAAAVHAAFLLATSVLFFASFAQVLPGFYSARPWLR